MCLSSVEITVSMRHLVFVTLCVWLCGIQGGMTPDSHPHRVTNTKCRIDTVILRMMGTQSPETCRKQINILRKLCTKLALFRRRICSLQTAEYQAIQQDNAVSFRRLKQI